MKRQCEKINAVNAPAMPDNKSTITSLNDAPAQFGCLAAQPANQWMKDAEDRPTPADLHHGMIHEEDLAILFAPSGAGKSIYAVQFANDVSQKERVFYLDCEMSDKQFQHRYAGYTFNPNFIRGELFLDAEKPQQLSDEEFIIQSLEEAVLSLGIKILIVDNITYLRSDTEKARDALSLMKKLKELKKKHGLTVLAIAHTPKRDASRPLSQNDLAGSMMLYNFCDAVFAIGVGNDPRVRYVKQLKTRYTEIIYGESNVITFEIEKRLDGFLQFKFTGYGSEIDYLSARSRDQRDEQIIALHLSGNGVNDIARQLKISNATVSRVLSKRNVTVNNDN